MGTIKPVVVGIESSLAMQKMLQTSMQGLDINLMLFSLAKEGWNYLESNRVDLLILSILLPDKNGLTLLSDLRQLPIHKETKTIIITTKDYMQDRVMAENLNVLDFMAKPIPIKKITDAVVKYVLTDLPNEKSK